MRDRDSMRATPHGSIPDSPPDSTPDSSPATQMVERERALAFSEALRILLQRQQLYVPLTGTYLLPQLYERVRAVDGQGIHVTTLRAYLRGEILPSDGKVRLLADALGVPRGMLLYAAGYLAPEDLPNYPGPDTTLECLEADMREVEALPLAPQTKERVLRDLRTTARIVHLVAAERAAAGYAAEPLERERIIEHLIGIWESAAPPPPPLTSSEEETLRRERATPAPVRTGHASPAAPVAAEFPPSPSTAPVAQPAGQAPVGVPQRSIVR